MPSLLPKITTKMSSDAEPRKPTEKEAFFFLTILNSTRSAPDVDWDLVAERAGYSNAGCARTRYGQIKKQIGYKEDGSTPAASSNKTPRKPRAKKEVGSGTNKNPSKVTKSRTPKKPSTSKAAEADFFSSLADDDEMLKIEQDGMDNEDGGYENNDGLDENSYYHDSKAYYEDNEVETGYAA